MLTLSLVIWLFWRVPGVEEYYELRKLNLIQYGLVKAEILDIRECNRIFKNFAMKDTLEDILIIYGRFVELRYAPRIWTHLIFTHHPDDLYQMKMANTSYQRHLDNLLEMQTNQNLADKIRMVKADTKYLYDIYDNLCDSKRSAYLIYQRRKNLLLLMQKLEALEEGSFLKGKLPYHLPLWEFTYLR